MGRGWTPCATPVRTTMANMPSIWSSISTLAPYLAYMGPTACTPSSPTQSAGHTPVIALLNATVIIRPRVEVEALAAVETGCGGELLPTAPCTVADSSTEVLGMISVIGDKESVPRCRTAQGPAHTPS